MTFKYKEEQQQLIKLASLQQLEASDPSHSVWVEASAGTGKTKVLSDRVLRLLLSGVSPEKILCLTYTKAAAVEMNERIAKRLSSWSIEDEDVLRNELLQLLGSNFNKKEQEKLLNFARTLFALLLDTPGGMKIQTIHSFCEDILKRFPLEAGISPYFEVLDDRQSREILQQIKSDLLKTIDDKNHDFLSQAVLYLTQNISEYKFPQVLNMITENRHKIDTLLKIHHGNISSIISLLETKLGVSYGDTPQDIIRKCFEHLDGQKITSVIDIFNQGSPEDIKRANAFKNVLENNFSADCFDCYKSIFLTDKNIIRSRLATQKLLSQYPHLLEFMTKEAEIVLDTLNKLKAHNILHATVSVLFIAKEITDAYNQYKNIYATLDYEDLILITKNLLENRDVADWVLFKLDGGIDHILIDEAQDTSPNQWAIIRALTQDFFSGMGQYENKLPRSIFVVGDRKQSIYSFQGADPKEFDRMYHYFEKRIQNFSKVHLDVSFRSTKAIMDCVNALFDNEEVKKGVIQEGEHVNHRPFRLGDGGQVEILPLLKNEESSDKNYNWLLPVIREKRTSLSTTLARQIAQNIKDIVSSGELLVSKNRPVRYGDFMFLIQQRNVLVEEFVRACKDIGVNVAGVDKLRLLEQIAVQDLISLGKFLLLPSDDLSLAESLKSPIFGLNDDELFELCYQRKSSLFENILNNPSYQSLSLSLQNLLNKVGFLRPFELFSFVLTNLGARKNFISRMGEEVNDILDEFINLTLVFEQKHTPTLEAFINWIVQDEVIIKKEMEQGESNTVKIMTVHGSKGLQSPIVILADTTRTINTASKGQLLWDDSAMYFPSSASCYDKICTDIKNAELDAEMEEYRRLLYVALTRAEDRLYIAGFTKDKDTDSQSWYNLIKDNIKSNVDLAEHDERIVYSVPQENSFGETIKISTNKEAPIDYSYLLSSANEEHPLSKPYNPSHDSDETDLVASPLEEDGNFYKRGIATHKLLQYISGISEENRHNAAEIFLKKHLPDFSPAKRADIIDEVIRLCLKYPDIFSQGSLAEVPIIGEIDGKIISAKIDRLVINEDKIIIVDYKTNRPAAESLKDVPPIYLRQLHTYEALVRKIYPNKNVEIYILWTNTCHMMRL